MGYDFDFESIKKKILEQLKLGKSLLARYGALAPLLGNLLNAALEGEMDAHLDDDEHSNDNRRNGHISKQV